MKNRKLLLLLSAAVLAVSPLLTGANTTEAALSAEAEKAAALRRRPSGMVQTAEGTVLVTDLYNKVIWNKSGDSWIVYAGSCAARSTDGAAAGGYFDGGSSEALFQSPWGIAPFLGGYAVTDTKNNVVRLIRGQKVSTAAGRRESGYRNGRGSAALFDGPTGVAAAENGALFIADTGNHAIRRLSTNGQVTTVLGGTAGCVDGTAETARLREPTGLCYADGVLYIADSGNHRICRWSDGLLTTLAGAFPDESEAAAGQGDLADGSCAVARFRNPQGVAVGEDGAVYVADTGNAAIRKIADGQVSTIYDQSISGTALYPVFPRGMLFQSGGLWAADTFAGTIYHAGGL